MASLRTGALRCRLCSLNRLEPSRLLFRPLVADRAACSTSAVKLDSPVWVSAQSSLPFLPLRGSRMQKRPLCGQRVANILLKSQRRHASTASVHELESPTLPLPALTDARSVSPYLFVVAVLVFAIVVVGGLTRLTESGLSITEWQLVTGVLPPLNEEQWQIELDKYSKTPEGMILNKNITMSEFKRIFLYEWTHRLLGRVIGLTFLLPIPYFLLRRRLSGKTTAQLLGIGTLIGGQGALGWYMVKSGLTQEGIAQASPHGVPRVSQYRLAAHLGMAFAVYACCLRLGIGLRRDWLMGARGLGVGGISGAAAASRALSSNTAASARLRINALTGMVFVTAISGAFVAGLDAGLLYNTFPKMGDDWMPPVSELYSASYARAADGSDLVRRNVFENPTTVQFNHRCLAISTLAATWLVFLSVRRRRTQLPRTTYQLMMGAAGMSALQATLGISTLVYLVPTYLAAAHQAGSLVLLSLCIAAGSSLRRPGAAARAWIAAKGAKPSVNLRGLPRDETPFFENLARPSVA